MCMLAAPVGAGAQSAPSNLRATFGFIAGGEGVTGAFRGGLAYGTTVGLMAQFPLSRHFSLRGDFLDHSVGTSRTQVGCLLDGGGPLRDPCGATCTGWLNCAPLSPWEMATSATVSAVFRLNDPAVRWSPYMLGGIAAYELERVTFAGYRPNHIGFAGGVGFEFRPNRNTYFVEMRYLGIPPGGLTPVSVGIRF
jgi:hypothetical protein